MPRYISERLKKAVWNFWNYGFDSLVGKCPKCRKEIKYEIYSFTMEWSHILAYTKGGRSTCDNIIPLCIECNRRMGTNGLYFDGAQSGPMEIDPFCGECERCYELGIRCN